jgi:hypothetical protein
MGACFCYFVCLVHIYLGGIDFLCIYIVVSIRYRYESK